MTTVGAPVYGGNSNNPFWLSAGINNNLATSQITLSPTPPVATGGTITTANGYRFHTFTSSGTFTLTSPTSMGVQVLVVGGGGGGGGNDAGGGGAGGAVLTSLVINSGDSAVVVGNGGAGGSGVGGYSGTNGQSSSFSDVTVVGGGGGSGYGTVGLNGGCGGAGGAYANGGVGSVGYNGGNGAFNGDCGGGGGGMGSAGVNGSGSTAGNGGLGRTFVIGGVSYTLAGGGGGGGYIGQTAGTGSAGGGNGAVVPNTSGGNATANTGSGGGGSAGGGSGGAGGNGGSGIVIVAYKITGDLVLTNVGGVLTENGVAAAPTDLWSIYPATSNTIYMDDNNTITNVGSNLYFNGNLIANASDISNISDWSLYAAHANVTLSNGASNYDLVGARSITAISNISGLNLAATSNITSASMNTSNLVASNVTASTRVTTPQIYAATNLDLLSGGVTTGTLSAEFPRISNQAIYSISNIVDRGVDVGGDASNTILAKNGRSGIVTIQANSGANTELSYGQVNITANGTTQSAGGLAYAYGGLINITANTPTAYAVTSTSAVKINGSGVNIYAGAFSSFGSLAGQLYLWGQLGTSLTSSAGPPAAINPLTVYIYGTNGTKIDGDVYMARISNIPGSNIDIHPDSSNWVDMLRVQKIGMGNNPVIDGGGSNAKISNFTSISATGVSGTTGYFTTLNSTTITPPDLRPVSSTDLNLQSFYQAAIPPFTPELKYNINLNSGYNINLNSSNGGKVYVNGVDITATDWATIPATQSPNLSNFGLSNCSFVTASGALTLNGTSVIIPETLNLSNNNIINCGTINGGTILTNPASADLNMGNNSISNVPSITGGFAGSLTLGSSNVIVTGRSGINGAVNIGAGSNYHFISMTAGSPMTITTSNAFNLTASNAIGLTGSLVNIYSQLNMNSNNLINVGTINGANFLTNPLTSNLNAGTYSISNCGGVSSPSILQLNGTAGVSILNTLNLGSYGVINTGSLGGVTTINGGVPITSPVSANLNMADYDINNVGNLTSTSDILISTTGSNITLASATEIDLNATRTLVSGTLNALGTFNRQLGSTPIAQPITQYGGASGTGTNGSVTVTLPTSYTSTSSYRVFVTQNNTTPANYSAVNINATSFNIYWTNGGSGSQPFNWFTVGT